MHTTARRRDASSCRHRRAGVQSDIAWNASRHTTPRRNTAGPREAPHVTNLANAMDTILQNLLGITLVAPLVGSLFEVGLKLRLREAIAALHNVQFVTLSLLWAFVLCPMLALLLSQVVPLSEPYAI